MLRAGNGKVLAKVPAFLCPILNILIRIKIFDMFDYKDAWSVPVTFFEDCRLQYLPQPTAPRYARVNEGN